MYKWRTRKIRVTENHLVNNEWGYIAAGIQLSKEGSAKIRGMFSKNFSRGFGELPAEIKILEEGKNMAT